MRKHRLSGVVIAVLIGLGPFSQLSGTHHRTPGRGRAGIQLTSADIPAGRDATPASAATTSFPSKSTGAPTGVGGPTGALLDLVAGHAAAMLSSPFGTEALVLDIRLAQANEQAEASAYLTATAEKDAATKAYLEAVAPPKPPPVVTAVTAPAAARAEAGPANPWAALRQCESDGNYGDDTGNGYYGAYQFNLETWRSLGFGGIPSQAPAAQQDQAARELEARRGWGQWPSCARRLGL